MAGDETVTLRADDGRGRTSDISVRFTVLPAGPEIGGAGAGPAWDPLAPLDIVAGAPVRSEEHTSELPSLMRISYAVFCLKKKKHKRTPQTPSEIKSHAPP